MIKKWIPLAQVHQRSSRALRDVAALGKTDYQKHRAPAPRFEGLSFLSYSCWRDDPLI
jgi:hypothetical protein